MKLVTSLHMGAATVALLAATQVAAQDTSYSLYGAPGLIEMPTARSAADAEIAASLNAFRLQQRAAFTFQLTPGLTGTFRYSGISERSGPGTDGTFDRSFDLRYRILDEGTYTPALAIGLQDFLGTGILASEYIVASKAITDRIDVTAGLGWGRLGTRNGLTNPLAIFGSDFETRPARVDDEGGQPASNMFFRGDAAFFGGVSWQYSDQLTFKAEYSSDAYVTETAVGNLDNRTPINVGLTYNYSQDIALSLAYLHGSEIAAGATFAINPRVRLAPSGLETAPLPVRVRPADARAAATWGTDEPTLVAAFAAAGITLNGYDVNSDTVARVRYTNTTYRSEAQAMGRVARILSAQLPAAVEVFVLEPMQNGIPLNQTTLQRRDIELLENRATGAADILARAQITDAGPAIGFTDVAPVDPAFTWGLGPYAALIVFNGNSPLQLDGGLDLRARYRIAPNLVVQGKIRQSFRGASALADEFETPNDYHNVRTDARLYGRDGHPVVSNLTLAHYGRPGADLYSRVSLGYLETMYGGLSTEVLWKPVASNFAVGAEVNYVVQRDFDLLFGFQDYDTVTGHLSGYYSFDNGFHAQVDVGRYLASDWGATFTLDREFENGWKVGAYFTLTDMPFDQYGEGSFDKGIRITVPTDFFIGTARRSTVSTSLASLTRDGGARVSVDGRLYDLVRDGHTGGPMGDTWGRFWR